MEVTDNLGYWNKLTNGMNKYVEWPHSLNIKTLIDALASNINGLTSEDAKKRLLEYGFNELPKGKSISLFLILLKQFKSWLVVILIIAAIISWFANQKIDV